MAVHSDADYDVTSEADDAKPDTPVISLHETRPGRKVLTEEDNTDGWIASDLVVDVHE